MRQERRQQKQQTTGSCKLLFDSVFYFISWASIEQAVPQIFARAQSRAE